jgi:transposase-like protein
LRKSRARNGTTGEVGLVSSTKGPGSEEGQGHVGGPERSEGSRSEPERSGGVPTSRRESPDPEVPTTPQRRRYTAEFKMRILNEVAKCRNKGEIAALLRREGLYSSTLTNWRREYSAGGFEALKARKSGPKTTRTPADRELEKLRRENARLQERLGKAELIIEAQKKLAKLLGEPIVNPDDLDERP